MKWTLDSFVFVAKVLTLGVTLILRWLNVKVKHINCVFPNAEPYAKIFL